MPDSSRWHNWSDCKDVIDNADAVNAVPQHDLTASGARKREHVVGDHPIRGAVGHLDRPTFVHVVEDVVADGGV